MTMVPSAIAAAAAPTGATWASASPSSTAVGGGSVAGAVGGASLGAAGVTLAVAGGAVGAVGGAAGVSVGADVAVGRWLTEGWGVFATPGFAVGFGVTAGTTVVVKFAHRYWRSVRPEAWTVAASSRPRYRKCHGSYE